MQLDLTPANEKTHHPRTASRREKVSALGEAPTTEELARLQEMLMHRIDETQTVAERIEAGARSLGEVLQATEAMLRGRAEEQERTMRAALAGLERQWGEAAGRFRVLADDLARRAAGTGERHLAGNGRPAVRAFAVGALAAIMLLGPER